MTDASREPSRYRQKLSLKIAGIYAVLGGLWIFFSDYLAGVLAPPGSIIQISIIKGWLYIVLTALLLYYLISHGLKQVEKSQGAHRLSEERFRAMFELASVGMAQADPHTGSWQKVNEKLCAITGYSAQELVGRRFSELTHPEDLQHDWEDFQVLWLVRSPPTAMRNATCAKTAPLSG